eukprot:COSAG06_NODE_3268_length_5589_cov_69.631857_2_plen_113_part_00
MTRKHFPSQLYVHAVCSCPAHPNVCQLKGWGIKSKGPTLEGLTDGDQVYMVQEFAGEELQKIIDEGRTVAPNLAYNYLQQLATGGYPSIPLKCLPPPVEHTLHGFNVCARHV